MSKNKASVYAGGKEWKKYQEILEHSFIPRAAQSYFCSPYSLENAYERTMLSPRIQGSVVFACNIREREKKKRSLWMRKKSFDETKPGNFCVALNKKKLQSHKAQCPRATPENVRKGISKSSEGFWADWLDCECRRVICRWNKNVDMSSGVPWPPWPRGSKY